MENQKCDICGMEHKQFLIKCSDCGKFFCNIFHEGEISHVVKHQKENLKAAFEVFDKQQDYDKPIQCEVCGSNDIKKLCVYLTHLSTGFRFVCAGKCRRDINMRYFLYSQPVPILLDDYVIQELVPQIYCQTIYDETQERQRKREDELCNKIEKLQEIGENTDEFAELELIIGQLIRENQWEQRLYLLKMHVKNMLQVPTSFSSLTLFNNLHTVGEPSKEKHQKQECGPKFIFGFFVDEIKQKVVTINEQHQILHSNNQQLLQEITDLGQTKVSYSDVMKEAARMVSLFKATTSSILYKVKVQQKDSYLFCDQYGKMGLIFFGQEKQILYQKLRDAEAVSVIIQNEAKKEWRFYCEVSTIPNTKLTFLDSDQTIEQLQEEMELKWFKHKEQRRVLKFGKDEEEFRKNLKALEGMDVFSLPNHAIFVEGIEDERNSELERISAALDKIDGIQLNQDIDEQSCQPQTMQKQSNPLHKLVKGEIDTIQNFQHQVSVTVEDIRKAKKLDYDVTQEMETALIQALKQPISLIKAEHGCGKTVLAAIIVGLLRHHYNSTSKDFKILCCSTTITGADALAVELKQMKQNPLRVYSRMSQNQNRSPLNLLNIVEEQFNVGKFNEPIINTALLKAYFHCKNEYFEQHPEGFIDFEEIFHNTKDFIQLILEHDTEFFTEEESKELIQQNKWQELKDLKQSIKSSMDMMQQKFINESKVIVTTCIVAGDIRLCQQEYDAVIVDDADIAFEPAEIIPISLTKKQVFMLSNLEQYSQSMRYRTLRQQSMNQSLFTRLEQRKKLPLFTFTKYWRCSQHLELLKKVVFDQNIVPVIRNVEEPETFLLGYMLSQKQDYELQFIHCDDFKRSCIVLSKLITQLEREFGATTKDCSIFTFNRSQQEAISKEFGFLQRYLSNIPSGVERKYVILHMMDENNATPVFSSKLQQLKVAMTRSTFLLYIIGDGHQLNNQTKFLKRMANYFMDNDTYMHYEDFLKDVKQNEQGEDEEESEDE